MNVARWILGEPDDVFARARVDGVDMTVHGLLHFPGGSTASVWASFESPEEQEPFSHMDPDPYRLMAESFAESVMKDEPVALPLSDSIANMRVLDTMKASAGI